jgi:hypothetical protein
MIDTLVVWALLGGLFALPWVWIVRIVRHDR